jgi:SAM-dependent methyltransferase
MHHDIASGPVAETPTTWGRAFALLYDPFVWAGERAGVRALRRELLEQASGRTIEIGAGTGLNLPLYPRDLDELVLLEPDASMRTRLGKKLRSSGPPTRVIDASAEHLPFADGSVDTVVSTFVLCTVDAPEVALREIRRVLRPDGQLLLIEHVRAETPRLARWQDRLAGPWSRFAQGCRCNRATAELIAGCGFSVADVHEGTWPAMPPIVRPLVAGRARTGRHDG